MRIPIFCRDCEWAEIEAEIASDAAAQARGEDVPQRPARRPLNLEHWYLADIEEDNAYVKKCRQGHEMRATLQTTRYELLYESGIVATLVGFHREAVSSIASALERFFEFAIEVFTHRAGIDAPMHIDAWKHVRKQSERQLGAFLYLFLMNLKSPFLSGKRLKEYEERSSFRNEVIHQGRFPSSAETMAYARYVFDLIQETRATLTRLDAGAVELVRARHHSRGHQAVQAKAGPPMPDKDGMYRGASGAAFPMMLSTFDLDAPRDFDSRLVQSKANLWLWGFQPQKDAGAAPSGAA